MRLRRAAVCSRPRAAATRAPTARSSSRTARELHAHCYRMLGSLHDAEDALQDTLAARVARASPASRAAARCATGSTGSRPTPAWTSLARRPKRVLPLDYAPAADPDEAPGRPLAESVWIEPYPDASSASPTGRRARRPATSSARASSSRSSRRSSTCRARQRAVLILREVLGFSAAETAEPLETDGPRRSTARCSARAGRRRAACPRRASRRRCARSATSASRELVARYMDAMERADVDAVARAARRGRGLVDAADVDLVHGAATRRRLPRRARRSVALAAHPARRRTASSPSAATAGSRNGLASSARSSTC